MFINKISTFLLSALLLLGCENKSMKKVAIIQAIDHPALNQARLGVMEAIAEAGFIRDENIQMKWESTQGNLALATQIAQKYVGQHVDVIVAIGTMPAQAALQATHGSSIPIVYTSVTDPKGAKLEGNITGVSDHVESKVQFGEFKRILPTLKIIGVIYNPGEANSVALVEEMKDAARALGMEIIFAPSSKTSDVYTAAISIIGKVDALFVNNDNTALAAFDSVLKAGVEHKKPVFVSDIDLVEKGALAAMGPDQQRIGFRAGNNMVVPLLKGTQKSAHSIAKENTEITLLHINLKAAAAIGLQLDDRVVREAIKIIG